jgi:N-acetylneuraminic acid mutarotase
MRSFTLLSGLNRKRCLPQRSKGTPAAILSGLCFALAGCDRAPTSDLTEPEAVTSEAAGAATQSTSQLIASNTWATKRSLSPWRRSMAAGTISGTIYVVGGRRRDLSALARVDAYNVAANTWSQVASIPSARVEPNGATVIQGKLYVAGGLNRDGRSTKTLFVYDPGTNSWSRKADMPQAGGCGGAQGVISGQLYVYTGCYAAGNMGRVFFRYNPTNNSWVTRAAPPVDHRSGAGGVVDGQFYLAGGFKPFACGVNGQPAECDEVHRQLDVYNPATNTWMTRAPMLRIRSGMAAAMLKGKLFVAGGSEEIESAKLEVYDPMTNRWTMKAPMPNGTSDGAAAVAGGKLFFIAGVDFQSSNAGFPSKVYAYTP